MSRLATGGHDGQPSAWRERGGTRTGQLFRSRHGGHSCAGLGVKVRIVSEVRAVPV